MVNGAELIFVMSTSKKLYAGERKEGVFHHSSFLAGGATLAAGKNVAVGGELKSISWHPSTKDLTRVVDIFRELNVNMDGFEVHSYTDHFEHSKESKSSLEDGKLKLGKMVDGLSSDPTQPTKFSKKKALDNAFSTSSFY